MPSWKITLASGKTYNQATISAGQYVTVSELLNGATWGDLEPTAGPRQLVAWLAVLTASESDDKDVASHLVKVMQIPMVDVMSTLQVTE